MKYILSIMLVSSILKVKGQDLETVEAKYSGKPIIQMNINDKKSWVLLDTGSEYTVLDSESEEKFDFHINHSKNDGMNVSGLGSSNNQLKEVENASIRFGHVTLKGPIYAFDLTTVANSIQLRTGKRVTAIIGTHMMRNHSFVIDMGKNTATLHVKPEKRKDKKYNSDEIVIARYSKITK